MVKKKKQKTKKGVPKEKKRARFALPESVRQKIWGVVMALAALIISLAFFGLAGAGGRFFNSALVFLLGKTVFVLPLVFILGALMFFSPEDKSKWVIFFALLIFLIGIAGVFGTLSKNYSMLGSRAGGWLGYALALPLNKAFGLWVSLVIFGGVVIVGTLLVFQFLAFSPKRSSALRQHEAGDAIEESPDEGEQEEDSSLIGKLFKPRFRIRTVESRETPRRLKRRSATLERDDAEPEEKLPLKGGRISAYVPPPLKLLEEDRGLPSSGDIKLSSAVIKRTLQNFDIPVDMAEVSIGPTVTQYTLRPAEGVKLSKITALSNDLALALSAHPIRIEAPIPGKPLVGIEVPNKRRVTVRLKRLLKNSQFQGAGHGLLLSLGKDVAGTPVFADLAKMPHLLLAGATGTGKTICLNNLILSLIYRHGPEALRFILVDPKRVELSVYQEIPHLLCPVICNAQKTVNALKWSIGEMERRFDILSGARVRDIMSFNLNAQRAGSPILPYLVVVIDELADLMAARGKEIEATVVRLAQMARAVGIHLIVATQRPSVEVITGLIKANITSRISFRVASQVDSRTVLDMAGAEKLLGLGDMLFLSPETKKPKRIQGAYVSEKEVKRVAKYLIANAPGEKEEIVEAGEAEGVMTSPVQPALDIALSHSQSGPQQGLPAGSLRDALDQGDEDAFYTEAKDIVIRAKRASASLLQRRLRIGYARAARLIDVLEADGVVGPADGAKPREVYLDEEDAQDVGTGESNADS